MKQLFALCDTQMLTVMVGRRREKRVTIGLDLVVTGNGNKLNSISGFDSITFTGMTCNGANALSVSSADVTGTSFNVESMEGGHTYQVGDHLTLLQSENAITGTLEDIQVDDTIMAGVTQDLQVETVSNENSIGLEVQSISLNPQVDLIAENRAVAAAFVNQGTDLISDSLDTLSHDGRYGTKTFAAVYGNRSKYDVNSDLKINGWSTIVGVGNTHKVKDGDLSWGVFYENGTGNYRTYNSFNNEFFRGDGSLLYNGGGAAVRYNRDNGWYYEGSLRAGTLKSDMDNALMDSEEKHYGYSSESTYYGAHIGVGKVFSLRAARELDVYGKFFHTYTDGDNFDVAGDRFEFDDITSDRLRIGARIRTNSEERVSTYYGLAYEYEFNGDADMRAAGLDALTQSLQGSTYMAELGLKYQSSETSPWNLDLSVRGYAGEREGGSFYAQVSYLF